MRPMYQPTPRRRAVRFCSFHITALALAAALIAPARATASSTVRPDSARRASDSAATLLARRPSHDSAAQRPRAEGEAGPAAWRERLEQRGVSLELAHITDASSSTRALSAARSVRTYGSADLTVHLDSLIGLRGLTVFVQYEAKSGRNVSEAAEVWQNVSNIDAEDFHELGEIWAEQRLFSERVRVKAGRLDFNKEFAGTVFGGDFLNASMGYSPSITAAPTYPLPSLGANAFVSPTKSLSIGVGVFNGIDGAEAAPGQSSLFEIAQATQQWALRGSHLAGQLGFGAWRHTGMFRAIDAADDAPAEVARIRGWFATLDQELWHGSQRSDADDDHATIAAFAQAGRADPRAQAIYTHAGGGLTFSGMVPLRVSDVIGVGVTRASLRAGREIVTEAFYQLPVTSHFALEADVQRVSRQDWGAERRLGIVSTLRTIIRF